MVTAAGPDLEERDADTGDDAPSIGIAIGVDILIVDDDPGNLTAYEAALAPLGRRLVSVQSGVSALGKLLEQDFALVLLDVQMPGMGGIETARRVRQRPGLRAMPIIFITGAAFSGEMVLDGYAAGGTDFLIKPVLPEVLRAKIRVYLQLQDQARVLAERSTGKADAAALRLRNLQDATRALAYAKTPDEVAAVAVKLGAEAAEASSAAIWFAQPDGSAELQASHGVPQPYLETYRRIPAGARLPITRVMETREPLWIETASDHARDSPETYEAARAAGRAWGFASLPLVAGERVVAVLSFSYAADHRFPADERAFLLTFARACEQALERARLYLAEAEARQAAELAGRRKDEFLAMLGHELRNPLWVVCAALERLKTREPPGREVAMIDRQVDKLRRIVDDLVDVSRITQGKIKLQREAVDLAEAVADALEPVRAAMEQRHHEIAVRVAGGMLVDADRFRLVQVLENLLYNACAYTPDRGRIEISAELDGPDVQIVVHDNGDGIPPSLLPHLFELFVQGERELDRRQGGLGIGLTLARTVVTLHGGSIEAQSDGPGRGSTFIVRWPKAWSRTRTAKIGKLARRVGRTSLRVLVVDDNADAATLVGEMLESVGHQVSCVHTSNAALELAERFAPDVAVLDIGLPGIDGYELADRIRRLASCSHTRFIAVTGYGQPEDRERSERAGFAHHLVKPVDLVQLDDLVQQVGALANE